MDIFVHAYVLLAGGCVQWLKSEKYKPLFKCCAQASRQAQAAWTPYQTRSFRLSSFIAARGRCHVLRPNPLPVTTGSRESGKLARNPCPAPRDHSSDLLLHIASHTKGLSCGKSLTWHYENAPAQDETESAQPYAAPRAFEHCALSTCRLFGKRFMK